MLLIPLADRVPFAGRRAATLEQIADVVFMDIDIGDTQVGEVLRPMNEVVPTEYVENKIAEIENGAVNVEKQEESIAGMIGADRVVVTSKSSHPVILKAIVSTCRHHAHKVASRPSSNVSAR